MKIPHQVSIFNLAWGFTHIIACRMEDMGAPPAVREEFAFNAFEHLKQLDYDSVYPDAQAIAKRYGIEISAEISEEIRLDVEDQLIINTEDRPLFCATTMGLELHSIIDPAALPPREGPYIIFSTKEIQDAG